MTIDRRFALLANDGDVLFPYIKTESTNNRAGFALSPPGKRDAKGSGAVYSMDLHEVICRVVFDGWKVRAKTSPEAVQREGSFKLQGRGVSAYWIDPTLAYLVTDAGVQPQAGPLPSPQARWPFPLGDDPEESGEDLGGDPAQVAAAAAIVDADPLCQDLPPTTRRALINARIGQGDYRRELMELWSGRCAVTGCSVAEVLIASHAKPWKDSSNLERLDAFNGLLLAATVDRLFDRGLISFTDDGQLLKKPHLSDADLKNLGISPGASLSKVDARHRPYLAEHRKRFSL
jgi:hypothetical protein